MKLAKLVAPWTPTCRNKKSPALLAGPTLRLTSEEQLHSQRNAPNPTAEHFLVQEIRIEGQNVTLGSRRGYHSSITEHVAIAQTVVGMVENIENLRLQLQVFGLRDVCVLEYRQIEDSEARGCNAVPSYRGPRRSSSDHVTVAGINRRITDCWIETKKGRAGISIASVQRSAQERGSAHVSGATGRFANRKYVP